ncbi:hypothetical protein BGZ63DRAFT_384508 [Mariannaea sp. PMI_226]|nr:hypothetical protein BGZ63DRAFT_384508 [Mariannaea sp. PMI_226]
MVPGSKRKVCTMVGSVGEVCDWKRKRPQENWGCQLGGRGWIPVSLCSLDRFGTNGTAFDAALTQRAPTLWFLGGKYHPANPPGGLSFVLALVSAGGLTAMTVVCKLISASNNIVNVPADGALDKTTVTQTQLPLPSPSPAHPSPIATVT